MGEQRATQTTVAKANLQGRTSASQQPHSRASARNNPFLHLQQTIGNRVVSRLIQAKLNVSQSDDKYEQEADRVAEQVVRLPDGDAPGISTGSTQIQRQCSDCASGGGICPKCAQENLQRKPLAGTIAPLIQRRCNECEEEEEALHFKQSSGHTPQISPAIAANIDARRGSGQPQPLSARARFGYDFGNVRALMLSRKSSFIQRMPENGGPATAEAEPSQETTAPPIVDEVLRSPGQSLDGDVRALMESRFGRDFSRVRVHTDARAAAAARAVNARAFTAGANIVFASGAYSPQTPQGKQLITHELIHVLQRRTGRTGMDAPLSSNVTDPAERQADSLMRRLAVGLPLGLWTPVAPSSHLSLEPESWYRGEAEGVKAAKDISTGERGVYHDLGEGKYFTNRLNVAEIYSEMRSLDPQSRRVLAGQVDPKSSGRVLDLTEEPEFMTNFNRAKKNLPKISGEPYRNMFEHFLKQKGLKKEDFDIIIGPEGIRDGKQMCIRNPNVASKVMGSMTLVKPGGSGTGSTGGEPPPAGQSGAPRQSSARKASTGANVPEGEVEGATRFRSATSEGGDVGETPRLRIAAPEVEGTPRLRIAAPEVEGGDVEVVPARRTMTMQESEGLGDMPPSPRTIVMGMTLSIAAGVGVSLLKDAFRSKVESDLAKLPKPKIDIRSAKDFLSDPNTADSMRLIDILSKDLLPFGRELQAKHQQVLAVAKLNLMAVGVSTLDAEGRLNYLSSIGDELDIYESQLTTIEDNLDAILDKKDEALKTAKACDDLRELLYKAWVLHHWLETGFSFDDHQTLDSNFSNLAVTIRMAFRDAQSLKDKIEKLEEEERTFRKNLSAVFNQEFAMVFEARLKEQQNRATATAAKPPLGVEPRKQPAAPIPQEIFPSPGAVAKPPEFSPTALIQPWDDRVKAASGVADKFERQKNWLVATESKLREMNHKGRRDSAEYKTLYQEFDQLRIVWPGQLEQSIALLEKENAEGYAQAINRLNALKEWLRTEGKALMEQVLPTG